MFYVHLFIIDVMLFTKNKDIRVFIVTKVFSHNLALVQYLQSYYYIVNNNKEYD